MGGSIMEIAKDVGKIEIKDDIITIKEEKITTVDLGAIKDEIRWLEEMKEPSDKELLKIARQGEVHDYYKINIPNRLIELKEELSKWA